MIHSGIPTLSKRCNGTVMPCVFVALDPTAANHGAVKTCGANGVAFGVSAPGTKNAPGLVAALGGAQPADYAGTTDDFIPVYSTGDRCLLLAGAGGFAEGDDLESDANGAGVTSTTAGHNVGAVAEQTVPAGSYGLVRVGRSVH